MKTSENTAANTTTTSTFASAKREGGWRTLCGSSPLPKGSPVAAIDPDDSAWERASERSARVGYEYGLSHTCTRPGFARKAEWQYWSLVRRAI